METQITLDTPRTRYASLEAWAKALGSSAKTRAGQRKAILASFPKGAYIPKRGTRVQPDAGTLYLRYDLKDRADAATYRAARTRARQERFAASHPLTLSHPAPATRADVQGNSDFEVSVWLMQDSRDWSNRFNAFARVGEWVVRCREDVSYDNHRYSKSWHSAHGGAKSVDARTVLIRRVRADGTLEARDQAVSAWRGNYLLDALIKAGVLEAQAGHMNIRLHPAYALETKRAGRLLTLYVRTLAGEVVDYCAVSGPITFHAPTVKAAIRGLREKLRLGSLKAKGQLVTAKLGAALGFCEAGMRSFADDFGLDYKGAYTPDRIADAVRQNPGDARKYAPELRTLAKAVGYDASELEAA